MFHKDVVKRSYGGNFKTFDCVADYIRDSIHWKYPSLRRYNLLQNSYNISETNMTLSEMIEFKKTDFNLFDLLEEKDRSLFEKRLNKFLLYLRSRRDLANILIVEHLSIANYNVLMLAIIAIENLLEKSKEPTAFMYFYSKCTEFVLLLKQSMVTYQERKDVISIFNRSHDILSRAFKDYLSNDSFYDYFIKKISLIGENDFKIDVGLFGTNQCAEYFFSTIEDRRSHLIVKIESKQDFTSKIYKISKRTDEKGNTFFMRFSNIVHEMLQKEIEYRLTSFF